MDVDMRRWLGKVCNGFMLASVNLIELKILLWFAKVFCLEVYPNVSLGKLSVFRVSMDMNFC